MEDQVKNVFKSLRSEHMTESEHIRTRNTLSAYMAEHPVRAAWYARATATLGVFTHVNTRVLSFALTLVLVVGVGTSYAAEHALPGEPLYALKVRVTEPIRGTFALTEVSKTEWDAEILERRIDEAEMLTAEGKWEVPVSEEAESRIKKAAERLHTRVAGITGTDIRVAGLIAEDARVATMIASEEPVLEPDRALTAGTERQKGERGDQPGTGSDAPVAMMMAEAPPAEAGIATEAEARTEAALTAATSTNEDDERDEDVREHAQKVEAALYIGREELRRGSLLDAVSSFRAAVREAKSIRVRIDIDTDAYEGSDRERNR
jgi:hypothetical protein